MAPDAHALPTLAPQTPAEPHPVVRLTRTARADWQPAEADPPLQAGAVIDGRYRVVAVIGEGGMGRVYETEHLFLRRRLALKLVRRDAGTGEAAARLLQEAVLAGKVPHATVVPVFDCAALPDGQVYVAMELLRGESLEEALMRPQRAEAVLRWLAEVARGLGAAHRAGIVHRDVKPANLFLARANDGSVQPRILDFGIAKLLPGLAGEAGAAVQTQAGALLGTPFYMAPERIRGETGDGSADLYGFGVILYEALTGQVPFVGEGFMEIVGRHLREPPLDPRQAAPQRRIPDALAELALALLRKDPQARPQGGEAVAAALLAVLGDDRAAVEELWLGAEAPVSVVAATQAIEEGSTQRLAGQVFEDMSEGACLKDGVSGDMSSGASRASEPSWASATAATLPPGLRGAEASRHEMSPGTGSSQRAEMAAGTGSMAGVASEMSLETGSGSRFGAGTGPDEPARSDMASQPGRAAGSLRAAALVLACMAGGLVAWVLMPREQAGEAAEVPARTVPDPLPVASPGQGATRMEAALEPEAGATDSSPESLTNGSAGSATEPAAAVTTSAGAEPEAKAADPAPVKKRPRKPPRKAGTTEPGPRESGPKIKTDVYDE